MTLNDETRMLFEQILSRLDSQDIRMLSFDTKLSEALSRFDQRSEGFGRSLSETDQRHAALESDTKARLAALERINTDEKDWAKHRFQIFASAIFTLAGGLLTVGGLVYKYLRHALGVP